MTLNLERLNAAMVIDSIYCGKSLEKVTHYMENYKEHINELKKEGIEIDPDLYENTMSKYIHYKTKCENAITEMSYN
jgi:hypothetical protein